MSVDFSDSGFLRNDTEMVKTWGTCGHGSVWVCVLGWGARFCCQDGEHSFQLTRRPVRSSS